MNVDSQQSVLHAISAGIVQGSRLGPRFFTIYNSDIPTHAHTSLSIFADDTSICSSNRDISIARRHLQEHILALEVYFDLWKIRINPEKTETMTISRRRDIDLTHNLTFSDVPIQNVMSAVYLGVKLNPKLSFNDNVTRNVSKATLAKKRLEPLLKHSCPLSTENKIMLYTLFLRPILTYNIPVWNYVSDTTYNKMQTFQNKCLRQALRLRPHPVTFRQTTNDDVHEISNVPFIKDFSQILTLKHYKEMIDHNNSLIRTLSHVEDHDVLVMRRQKSPYLLIRDAIS